MDIVSMKFEWLKLLCEPSPKLKHYDLTLQSIKFNREG